MIGSTGKEKEKENRQAIVELLPSLNGLVLYSCSFSLVCLFFLLFSHSISSFHSQIHMILHSISSLHLSFFFTVNLCLSPISLLLNFFPPPFPNSHDFPLPIPFASSSHLLLLLVNHDIISPLLLLVMHNPSSFILYLLFCLPSFIQLQS